MTTIVMQKLDEATAWHTLRAYASEQEAKFAALKWAKERGDKPYPKYNVNGFNF